MQRGKASRTASMVTWMRAMADAGRSSVPGFSDPTARHFLEGRWAKSFAGAREGRRWGWRWGWRAAFVRVSADLLALRTMVIDEHVRNAVRDGARQLVILGAGFDGRAYRMTELGQVAVFEVDHPDTQAAKTVGASALTPLAASLIHIPVDFERDSLDAALERGGHRRDLPTVWVWEGVVMYLTDDALRATLRTVGGRSAAASTLIIQYNRPGGGHPLALLLRFWGEPMIGLRSSETMSTELGAVGYRVFMDNGADDWRALFGGQPLPRRVAGRARILAARH